VPVPTPLAKDTSSVPPSVPAAPLEIEKKPLADELLSVSVVPPLPAVVLFPY
jgi:hypothetical protein